MGFVWDILIAFMGAIIFGFLYKFQKRVTYFQYDAIYEVVVSDKDVSIIGLLYRTVISVGLGFFVAILVSSDKIFFASLSAFLGSFMLIWPAILYGNELLPFEAIRKRKLLTVVYLSFVLSSTLGGFIGGLIQHFSSPNTINVFVNISSFYVKQVVIGVIIAIIVSLILHKFGLEKMFKSPQDSEPAMVHHLRNLEDEDNEDELGSK